MVGPSDHALERQAQPATTILGPHVDPEQGPTGHLEGQRCHLLSQIDPIPGIPGVGDPLRDRHHRVGHSRDLGTVKGRSDHLPAPRPLLPVGREQVEPGHLLEHPIEEPGSHQLVMTPQHELTGSVGPGHGVVHERTETDPDHLLTRKSVEETREHAQRVFGKRPGVAERSARPEHRWSGHDRIVPIWRASTICPMAVVLILSLD